MSRVLEITGLTVKFSIASRLMARLRGLESNEIDAVADVSLTIPQGQTYALVGESGSGKSTLARAINGLVTASPPSSILFEGRDIVSMPPRAFKAYRRHMAMMFQDPVGSLSPRMTVGAQLVEPFLAHGIGGRDLKSECRRLLDMVGLPQDFADRYPYELSGGQARRVGVARSLALSPKLIIADEPTAGLDVSIQGEVLNLLNELQQRLGLTLLIITHNLHIVRHIADRTAIMYLGRIVEEGPTLQTFEQPRHPYTQALLSAAPKPDPDATHARIELKGEIPSIARRPSGCEFHTRCPRARDVCSASIPQEVVEGERRYRCFFPVKAAEETADLPQIDRTESAIEKIPMAHNREDLMNIRLQSPKSTWSNWYGNLSCEALVVDAASEEEVALAVRHARSEGLNLRVAGTGHSNIALVPTKGVVVVTDRLKGLLTHDSAKRTVTLAAGTKIRDMGEMLWEHGLSLTNQGDIDTQSIAGAISTGTHGTGIGLTNLSARVRSMRLVDARGDIQELDGRDENRLRAARVSMGMLGAITAVELEASPAYHLYEWIGFMPYRAAAEIEDEMNARFRHFTYFWCPNKKSEHFISVTGVIQEGETDVACVRIFHPEPIELGELEKYTHRRRYDRSYRIFAEDYVPEFDEMEYMVPLEVGRECFDELTSTLHDIFHEIGIPTEMRVTAGDDNFLSEYQGGPRKAISLAGPIKADNSRLFAACDAVFARYQGRPHWAKANCMTKERLQQLYPHFDAFVAVRRQMDPEGVFLNDYLRRWFA